MPLRSLVILFVFIFGGLASATADAEPSLHSSRQALGFGYHKLLELDRALRLYVYDQRVQNLTYGIWKDGKKIASGAFGPTSLQNPGPVSKNTIYQIYSMTKPVTAVGLLILMERGHFRLDDPITKFLPELADTEVLADFDPGGTMFTYKARSPTMAQLLSHTAGFAYGTGGTGFIEEKLTALHPLASANTDELVSKVASVPYRSMPAAQWSYSISSDLQGAIIERITGEPLDVFLEREIFQPLGMVDTGFYVPDRALHRVSHVSRLDRDGALSVRSEPADKETQAQTFFEGGHGLFSTRQDYARFAHFLLNEGRLGDVKLLQPKTIKRFRTNAIRYRGKHGRQGDTGEPAGLGYGFGVGIIEDPEMADLNAPPGTYFWHGAFGTWFWVDPKNEIVFIGMIQSTSISGIDMLRLSMNTLYDPPVSGPDPLLQN